MQLWRQRDDELRDMAFVLEQLEQSRFSMEYERYAHFLDVSFFIAELVS